MRAAAVEKALSGLFGRYRKPLAQHLGRLRELVQTVLEGRKDAVRAVASAEGVDLPPVQYSGGSRLVVANGCTGP